MRGGRRRRGAGEGGRGGRHAAPCPADLPQAPRPPQGGRGSDLVGILAAEAAVPSPPS